MKFSSKKISLYRKTFISFAGTCEQNYLPMLQTITIRQDFNFHKGISNIQDFSHTQALPQTTLNAAISAC